MLNLIYPLAAAFVLFIVGVYLNKNYGYDVGTLRLSVGLFILCVIAVPFILITHYDSIVNYEGQIANMGSKGVIVTYSDEYGEAREAKISVDFPEKYDIGNTVIIRYEKDIWTGDLKVTILEDETEQPSYE